jgi:hypothetical protein
MLAAVSDQVLHIAIDVNLSEDQIHGQVGDGVRQPRPFCGWLGLIGQLDEMLSSPRHPAASSGDRGGASDQQSPEQGGR